MTGRLKRTLYPLRGARIPGILQHFDKRIGRSYTGKKKSGDTMTSQEKRQLISEANKIGMSVSEMVRAYQVSKSTIYKLLAQEKLEGNMAGHTDCCGRPSALDEAELEQMRELILGQPDITLEEIKVSMGLDICLSAIHRIIHNKLGFTYKKRQYMPANGTGRT
jgi:transposase